MFNSFWMRIKQICSRANPRTISPPLKELLKIEPKIDPDLVYLAKVLNKSLPPEWEIYIKPFLNGLRPGLVLLNESLGIVVLEVFKVYQKELIHACGQADLETGEPNDILKNLSEIVEKVTTIKKEIHDLYCPRLGLKSNYSNIYSAVVFMSVEQKALDEHLGLAMNLVSQTRSSSYSNHKFLGKNTVKRTSLLQGRIPIFRASPELLTLGDLAKDLRNWLVEPYFSESERRPLPLNDRQKTLVTTRTPTGYRRIKGPAGSGKSLVLAARAAELCLAGKNVLVVTFNITLMEYLRRLFYRYIKFNKLESSKSALKITWCNYHNFCKRLCSLSGNIQAYNALWREAFQANNGAELEDKRQEVLNEGLTGLIEEEILNPTVIGQHQYDAILVDEGQDFRLKWWNMLRKLLSEGGEMLLSADLTQDVYGTAGAWTDNAMLGSGFVGDWMRLDKSYRLPPGLIEYSADFAERYLPLEGRDKPVNNEKQGDLFTELRWVQTSSEKAEAVCVQEVLSLVAKAKDERVAFTDVTVLVPKMQVGLNIVRQIEAKGVKVISIFSSQRDEQRSLKMAFTMQEAMVKATSVQSFKGWETRALVVLVTECSSPKDKAIFYTAMTRLVHHDRGSFLTIVSAFPDLEEFGKTWLGYKTI